MIDELFEIIRERQSNPQPGSYTNRLLEQGADTVLQKVGEEAIEVILAAKGQGRRRLIEESADLFYHILVLLAQQGVALSEVEEELRSRHAAKKSA